MKKTNLLLFSTAFSLLLLIGCGSGPTLIPVEGVLTSNGHPIEAEVVFIPDPKNQAVTEGSATSGPDGRYALRSVHGAGVAEGAYVVRVKPIVPDSAKLGEVDPAMATFGQAVGQGADDQDAATERSFSAEVGPQTTSFDFDLKAAPAN
jgi:hypothetical protein